MWIRRGLPFHSPWFWAVVLFQPKTYVPPGGDIFTVDTQTLPFRGSVVKITILLLLTFMTVEPRWCADTGMLARFALSLSVGSGARVLVAECDPFYAVQACLRWPLRLLGLRSTSLFPQWESSTSYLPSRTSTTMNRGWLCCASFGSQEHTRRGSRWPPLRPPCRRPTSSLPQRHHHFGPREVARSTWPAQRA